MKSFIRISQGTMCKTFIRGSTAFGDCETIYGINTEQHETKEMYSQTLKKSPFDDSQWEIPDLEDFAGEHSVIKR
jgi:hypothetical protein